MPNRPADRVPRSGSRRAWPRRSRGADPAAPVARPDHGLWTVDRAVRALATACAGENRAVPEAYAVVVESDAVVLRLGTPDERPPAGWTAEQDGRTWRASLRWLQSAPVTDLPREPYPRLVSLGTGGTGFVLLNLRPAGGIVGLEGDGRQARALAQDWIRELAASPWSRDVRVVRVGFPSEAADADQTGARTLAEAEEALAHEDGGVLFLAGAPGGRDREHVQQLADDPERRWSVVVVGRTEQPRWRFAVDAAGVVDTGLLDWPVAHLPVPSAGAPARPPARTDAHAGTRANTYPRTAPAAAPIGGIAPANHTPSPSRAPVFTRWRIVIAAAVAACVAGTVVALASTGGSHGDAPAAQSENTRAGTPAVSTAPAALAPSTATATATTAKAGAQSAALVNPATGKCISGTAGRDGTPLLLLTCNDALDQAWAVVADGTIRTKGLCMDAAGGATTPGTVVQIANCSGNPAQQFSLRGGTIYSSLSHLCVSVANGGPAIHLSHCDGRAAEAFKRR